MIAAARELKRSLMHRLFTYGPYAEPMPTKETEIGEVPSSWAMTTVGEVFDIKLGKMLSQAAKGGDSPSPYVRTRMYDGERSTSLIWQIWTSMEGRNPSFA